MDSFGIEAYLFEPEHTEDELKIHEKEAEKLAVADTLRDSDNDTCSSLVRVALPRIWAIAHAHFAH